ncbi:MAG: protein TolQ [Desulfosarcinaceae bacterium]|nr:protein TolQ [Desulfosarcinaceae bacterium]
MGTYEIDVIKMISGAGLMVQFVLLLLLFFSVTSWAIIIVKFRYLRRAFKESDQFIDYFWKSRDLAGAFAKAKLLQGSPIARVFRIGYLELKKISQSGAAHAQEASGEGGATLMRGFGGSTNVKRALRRAINSETTRMVQMVPFLATTGNTTPFIGLFGTVWGIMNSFHGIGLRGSASLAVVAPGISEALIATAAGLAVAIPAVIAFNYFMQKIRFIESELNSFSADFLNILERDILQGRGR